MPNMKY